MSQIIADGRSESVGPTRQSGIVALRKEGMGATEIARAIGCKRRNVYKALKAAGLHQARKKLGRLRVMARVLWSAPAQPRAI